jgi:hypothetical protein
MIESLKDYLFTYYCMKSQYSKKGGLSYVSPQFCYPFITKRLQHPHSAGITRTQGCKKHDDLTHALALAYSPRTLRARAAYPQNSPLAVLRIDLISAQPPTVAQ